MKYVKQIISENGKYKRKVQGIKQIDCSRFLADNYVSWIESSTANLRIDNYVQYYKNIFPDNDAKNIIKEIEDLEHKLFYHRITLEEVKSFNDKFPLYYDLFSIRKNFNWKLFNSTKLDIIKLHASYLYLINSTKITLTEERKFFNYICGLEEAFLSNFENLIRSDIIKILYMLKTRIIYYYDFDFFAKISKSIPKDSHLLIRYIQINNNA
jgi:hypothetical protein